MKRVMLFLGIKRLFMTHPPLAERVAALRNGSFQSDNIGDAKVVGPS